MERISTLPKYLLRWLLAHFPRVRGLIVGFRSPLTRVALLCNLVNKQRTNTIIISLSLSLSLSVCVCVLLWANVVEEPPRVGRGDDSVFLEGGTDCRFCPWWRSLGESF